MSPRVVEQAAAMALRETGETRIAVVADTHSRPHAAMRERLALMKPDAILHAGDIGDLAVLDGLREIAPLFAVRGNIDVRAADLPDVLVLDVAGHGRSLRLLMTHIAVYGAKLRADVSKRARARRAALVVCGHSHVPFMGSDGGLTVFNPGSVGPRRFHLPIVFGTLDIGADGVRLQHIDCETGLAWSPP